MKRIAYATNLYSSFLFRANHLQNLKSNMIVIVF
jgi:hypothetical protein